VCGRPRCPVQRRRPTASRRSEGLPYLNCRAPGQKSFTWRESSAGWQRVGGREPRQAPVRAGRLSAGCRLVTGEYPAGPAARLWSPRAKGGPPTMSQGVRIPVPGEDRARDGSVREPPGPQRMTWLVKARRRCSCRSGRQHVELQQDEPVLSGARLLRLAWVADVMVGPDLPDGPHDRSSAQHQQTGQ
jgi:hypothetical protein